MAKHPQDLRVLMVHVDPCVRVLKEVQALQKHGVKMDLLCNSFTYSNQWGHFMENIYRYNDLNDLFDFLEKNHTNWDVIHCHNEPNEVTAVAISACDERPVIYDCHDLTSARSPLEGLNAEIEQLCFQGSAGVVHVSEGLKKFAFNKFGPSLSIVLPSFPLSSDAQIATKPKLKGKHVVYQGGLLHHPYNNYSYRFYLPMFVKLCEAGVHVHVFPAPILSKNTLAPYTAYAKKQPLFHLHKPLPYKELIKVMSQFEWGLSGFNFDYLTAPNVHTFLNSALPNKFFDYLLAGVCPIVINSATVADFARKHNVGYVAKDMDDFVRICTTEKSLPPLSDLSLIDMQTQIGRLLELYAAVQDRHKPMPKQTLGKAI